MQVVILDIYKSADCFMVHS